MKSYIAAIACFAALACSASSQETGLLPGSLELSISVPSMANIVGMVAAIVPSILLNNQTYSINFTTSDWTYSIFLNSIHINNFNINKRVIDFIPGTKTVRVQFSEINLDSVVDGNITMLGLIAINAAKLNFQNLTI